MSAIPNRWFAPMQGVSTSTSALKERYGYKWISVAPFGMAPGAPSEVRIVYCSEDRRDITFYEAIADKIEFNQSAIDVSEAFYVIEGAIVRTNEDGTTKCWRSGDVGYQNYEEPCHLSYSFGTRLVRCLWSATRLASEIGEEVTRGQLVGALPQRVSGNRVTSQHSHDDLSDWLVHYHGEPTFSVPIFLSEDRRRATIYATDAGKQGVSFSDPMISMREIQYITQGTIETTPQGGETVRWTADDIVYWPYDREQNHKYSVGLGCFCYFWSDRPLPDFDTGESSDVMLERDPSA